VRQKKYVWTGFRNMFENLKFRICGVRVGSCFYISSNAGYVALLGKPNVGKSTLANQMLGQKLSIVTDKPQTTRHRILCICSGTDYQVLILLLILNSSVWFCQLVLLVSCSSCGAWAVKVVIPVFVIS